MNPDSDPESLHAEDNGTLQFDILDDRVQWTFVPREDRLMPRPLPPHPALICELLVGSGELRISPIVPYADNERYMESKYDQIRCIQVERLDLASDSDAIDDDPQSDSWSFGLELEEVMDSLPGAFVKRWKHGLGITKRYRSIISVVEHIGDVRELHLSVTADTIELTKEKLH